jgi:hypothetical protein
MYKRGILTPDILRKDFSKKFPEAPAGGYSPNNDVWPLDCAYDKHTRIGSIIGRGMPHFKTEGCVIYNVPDWIAGIERAHTI